MTQTAVRPRRYPFLDELRGAAIVMMVLYHFLYDLVVFAGISFPLYSRPVVIWQNSIGALFITLSGCVSLFSRSNFRRGIKCLLAATAVFLVTAFTAPAPAWFGVLHFLGCAILLFPLFARSPTASRLFGALWDVFSCSSVSSPFLPERSGFSDSIRCPAFCTADGSAPFWDFPSPVLLPAITTPSCPG